MNPELKVCLEALRADATLWDAQAAVAQGVVGAAQGLHLSCLAALAFAIAVNANNDVCDFVARHCMDGQAAMSEVATALRENARTYEALERQITESVDNAY